MKAKTKRRSLIVVAMLVLLATVIAMSSATFAKYITSTGDQSNSATVAKWGFVVSADAASLFGAQYKGTGLATTTGDGTINVSGSGLVVAPGTTGSMTFSVSGQAEVYAELTLNVTVDDVSLSKTVGESTQTYNPIKWTLKKDTETVLSNATLAELNDYFADKSAEIAPNTAYAYAGDYELSWTWALENDASGIDGLTVDQADTLLGQAAIPAADRNEAQTAALADYTADTELAVTVSICVEQIQK